MPIDYRKLYVKQWPEQKSLDKGDFLIVLGDFGLLWSCSENDKEERYFTRELTERAFTTLFIDGNHENHTRLDNLEEVDMFGGKVGKVNDSIFHLKRGYIYTIAGKQFFCFGGAASTDKQYRLVDISWWAREIHSRDEENRALDNLEDCNYGVDYVLTHTAPSTIVDLMDDIYAYRMSDPVAVFLEHLKPRIKCRSWHFGHFHDDIVYEDKYHLHYNNRPLRLL
jgi:DNA repair exonuclease SbcCD nuclease subunit